MGQRRLEIDRWVEPNRRLRQRAACNTARSALHLRVTSSRNTPSTEHLEKMDVAIAKGEHRALQEAAED
jgi:hypothetical protein